MSMTFEMAEARLIEMAGPKGYYDIAFRRNTVAPDECSIYTLGITGRGKTWKDAFADHHARLDNKLNGKCPMCGKPVKEEPCTA